MPPNPHHPYFQSFTAQAQTTYHVEVEELMAVHGTMAVVRVDREEHLASADMVQALAQMKSPSDYPQNLTGKI